VRLERDEAVLCGAKVRGEGLARAVRVARSGVGSAEGRTWCEEGLAHVLEAHEFWY